MATERLEPLYYYKWLWKDWRSNRRVQRMHYVARGFYRELLDEQFIEGSIPKDVVALAEICGCPITVMKEYWPEIEPHFEDDGQGGLIHPKMETMRTEMDATRAKQSRAGKASAQSKLLNSKGNSTHVQQTLTGLDDGQPVRDRVRDRVLDRDRVTDSPPSVELALPSKNTAHEVIGRAFEVYCAMFERNPRQYALTPQRREKAEARLRERIQAHRGDVGAAELDIGRALENLQANEYNVTNGYIDWTDHIFKSQECFEKRMNWIRPKGGNGNGSRNGKTGGNLDALAEAERFARERNQETPGEVRRAPASADINGNAPRLLGGLEPISTVRH